MPLTKVHSLVVKPLQAPSILHGENDRTMITCKDSADGDAGETLGFVRAPTAQAALECLGGTGASVYPCFDDVALPDGIGPFVDATLPGSVGGSDGS